jgi:hypothetical protein
MVLQVVLFRSSWRHFKLVLISAYVRKSKEFPKATEVGNFCTDFASTFPSGSQKRFDLTPADFRNLLMWILAAFRNPFNLATLWYCSSENHILSLNLTIPAILKKRRKINKHFILLLIRIMQTWQNFIIKR